jgi:ABC-type transport system substrate-binding protein
VWTRRLGHSRDGSLNGGTLRFATRGDAAGLDPHRNTILPGLDPPGRHDAGLIDLDGQSQPVPGVATAWDVTDLLTYTFRLRQGVLFHNGVRWTQQRCNGTSRVCDAKVAHPFTLNA